MADVEVDEFGTMPDGTVVRRFTVRDAGGAWFSVMEYGGRLQRVVVPDRAGGYGDVHVAYEDFADYLADDSYLGALVGRYGNRIADGRLRLDGETYQLPRNDGPNTLHGGPGWSHRVWTGTTVTDGVRLELVDADGEQGFPGEVRVAATYTLVGSDTLRLVFEASTSAPTVVAPTTHAYWNLAGGGTVGGHVLRLAASRYAPVRNGLIPLGDLAPVGGTPFDFRSPTPVGARWDEQGEQLELGLGYDHDWAVDGYDGSLIEVGRLADPGTGRAFTLRTTEPGVQFYSGNQMYGRHPKRTGLCLETQHHPDSPNNPDWPTTVLRPGERLTSTTEWTFDAAGA